MRSPLRHLIEPTSTYPTDQFRWRDKRPVSAQVLSGIRKALGLIIGFFVIIAPAISFTRLSKDHIALGEALLFGTLLAGASVVMVFTANRWSPWVTGFFFGPAVLKLAMVLVLGSNDPSVSRSELAAVLGYAAAIVLLTARFIGDNPAPTTLVDRLALTFFALAMCKQLTIAFSFPPWPLILGGLALLVSWSSYRFKHAKRRSGHRRKSNA